MGLSDYEEYKRYVEKNLNLISEVFIKIADGELINRLDVSNVENKEFLRVFCGLNIILDKLIKIEKQLEKQNALNAFRIEIWQIAARNITSEEKLIQTLLNKVGPFLGIAYASFFSLDEKGDAVCRIQWHDEVCRSTIGLIVPQHVHKQFHHIDYVILNPETIPEHLKDEINRLFEFAGIKSFLAIPYPEKDNVQGFFNFSSRESEWEWTEKEICILQEIVNIMYLKTAQIHAEHELRKANQELEEKVKESTSELKRINDNLKQDISRREKIEKALRESEELYRTLILTSPDPIIMTDLNMNITMVNRATLELNGIEDENMLIGINALEFIAPRDREKAMENAKKAFKKGEIISAEYTLLKHDGAAYPAELCASSILDSDGNMKAFIAVIRDLTRRKAAEEALEKEKELFEVTLRSINEGVITTDIEGKVILINKVAEKLTGWNQRDALGKDFETIFTIVKERTLEYTGDYIDEILTNGKNIDLFEDKILLSRNGSKIMISGNGAPILDREGNIKGSVFVFRDIREKKMLEKEIFRARNIESLGILAGGIAHDFNNILTGVITNISIANTLLQDEGEINDLLKSAERAVFRASRLTNQLLTFSRGGAPVKESASIIDLIKESAHFCLSGSNIGCAFELPDDLWTVEIDKGQMYQVLNNIIYNAKEAMPDGGIITLKAENITIYEESDQQKNYKLFLKPGNYIRVVIQDNGSGIEKKYLDKIFDPYFTTKEHGSGLGLTSAYSIVKKHGGFIGVESEPGRGSNFEFYLPATEKIAVGKVVSEEKYPLSGGRVLVMDDDEDVRKVMVKLLCKMGYTADAVCEGKEAIERYRNAMEENDPYCMVIMDLTIRGGMQGKEAVKHILEYDPDAKVLVSSGYSNDPILAHFSNYGFCGVIPKPFTIDSLKAVFSNVFKEI